LHITCWQGRSLFFMVKIQRLLQQSGKMIKELSIIILYMQLELAFSFINPWLGFIIYAIVAAMWFIPDKRIEPKLKPG
jgi:uncharacterized membrane protein